MLNYIIPLFYCLNGISMHDFHISVCEIEYDEKSRALEITHRIFLDDLEETLRKWSGDQSVDVINPKDQEALQKMIGDYLLSKFSVHVNGKLNNLAFVGSEPEDDVMYCYVELTNVKRLKSIVIENDLLMEVFDDQTNVVHVYKGEETVSMRFSKPSAPFEKQFH